MTKGVLNQMHTGLQWQHSFQVTTFEAQVNKLEKLSPSVREAWPKTKFHDSLGYRSIMVIPTMQKASLGFLFFKKFNSSPVNKRKQFESQSELPFVTHVHNYHNL